ncbi:hypothetical protein CWI39_2838p0010, partial [Hamiltosporidium magnivora]
MKKIERSRYNILMIRTINSAINSFHFCFSSRQPDFHNPLLRSLINEIEISTRMSSIEVDSGMVVRDELNETESTAAPKKLMISKTSENLCGCFL